MSRKKRYAGNMYRYLIRPYLVRERQTNELSLADTVAESIPDILAFHSWAHQ
jgi:hypothetical protein